MSSELKLVILIEVQFGKADQQIALYNKIKKVVLAEEGCIQYEMNRVTGSDVQFVLLKTWASKAALRLHDEMPYMKEADAVSHCFRVGTATVLELTRL